MQSNRIPFNKPYLTGDELAYISEAHQLGQLSGDGIFTKHCQVWIERSLGVRKSLLTHSCTAALEMAAILCNIQPGDEVIVPSYTFVSSINAFVLRGAVPVFIDIREDTLNMDESLLPELMTPRTKAIVVVHYAGVPVDMDRILEIARRHNVYVVEDAAQALLSSYNGVAAGSWGDIGCFSFHETKNITSGEGGAITINNSSMSERAEIIREKGTDRSRFFRGEVDKYSWVDIGSSYLPGEIVAAFLWAQLQKAYEITNSRMEVWHFYHAAFKDLETQGRLRRPIIPDECEHNAHMYYLLLPDSAQRDRFIAHMKERGIQCVFHYVPLHLSAYIANTGSSFTLPITEEMWKRLVRIPMWVGLNTSYVVDCARSFF